MARIGRLTLRGEDWWRRGPFEIDRLRPPQELPAWAEAFGRPGPLRVEIGPGKGEFVMELAARHPDGNLVAIEVKRARVIWIEEKLLRAGIGNVRLVFGDALQKLPTMFPPASLSAVYVNFPDPWPRDRHTHRRMGGRGLVLAVGQLLAPGGEMVYVTDRLDRAGEAKAAFDAHPALVATHDLSGGERLPGYPVTVHEAKFRRRGRDIRFMRWVKRG